MRKIFDYISATFLDLFALLLFILFYWIDLTKKDPKTKGKSKQRPILLVHGYLHNSSAWILFRKRLMKAGFTQIYTINLGSPFSSIEHHAATLKKKIDKIAKNTERDDITLIGHSMGGVVSSYYATQIAQKGTVKEIITVGSPLAGTKMGVLGVGEDAREMCYHSDFMQHFSENVGKGTRYLHVWSPVDLLIIPHNSAKITGLSNHHNQKIVIGHLNFLFSRRVVKFVVNFLKNTTTS